MCPTSPKRRVLWAEVTACVLVLANLVMMGLPGALVVEPVESAIGFVGLRPNSDAAWPTAILAGFVMPFGFVITVNRLARSRPHFPTIALIVWGMFGYVVTGAVIAIALLTGAAVEQALQARSKTTSDAARVPITTVPPFSAGVPT